MCRVGHGKKVYPQLNRPRPLLQPIPSCCTSALQNRIADMQKLRLAGRSFYRYTFTTEIIGALCAGEKICSYGGSFLQFSRRNRYWLGLLCPRRVAAEFQPP